ncbi:unnamed protein product [Ambrosiozyma monospora]|uniref:Unnamed protein product n=1 Tax=Ambrosiozyma monospora TaxID=43982 RepID=A0A9W6Z092_AMBMO|nr:unnamed protein product [Ambrosiozyma monospora]
MATISNSTSHANGDGNNGNDYSNGNGNGSFNVNVNENTNDNNKDKDNTIGLLDPTNDPNSEQSQAYFKYKRSKSRRACQVCNRRKVRCDVMTKDYPREKCTNCEEFGVECILVERRKKRTKAQIEADRKRLKAEGRNQNSEDGDFYEENPSSLGDVKQSSSIPLDQRSVSSSASPQQQQQAQHDVLGPHLPPEAISDRTDPFSELKGDEIILDSSKLLSKEVDVLKLSQFFKVLTSHFGLRLALHDYYKFKGKIPVSDLITDECISMLKLAGCFILPNKEKCDKYIKTYFETFNVAYPLISKPVFYRDFADLHNPPSLLLLRTILFVGSMLSATTEEEKEEYRILYEKARLVYSSDLEPNGIYLATSIFIISSGPSTHPSLKTLEDHFSSAVKVAIAFGMHKDVQNSTELTKDEKSAYKRLFWILMIRDRSFALSFSKNFNFEESSCTVKPFTLEDFEDFGDKQLEIFEHYNYAVPSQSIINRITILQKRTNMAALKSLPITAFINEMNTIMEDFYKNSPPNYRDPSYSIGSLTTNVYILSLASSVQRVNLFRLHVMMLRNIKSESTTPGSSHYLEIENLDLSCSWTALVQVSHRMATIASECLLKFKDKLPYSQNMLFLLFQGVLGLLPVLFHDDERVRKMAEDDLQKVIPVMEEISDCISWHLTSVYHFILKEIYPDPVKLRRYVKMAINGKNLEALSNDSANYSLLNQIV